VKAAATAWVCSSETVVATLFPVVTRVIPFGPHPFLRANSSASQ